MPGFEEAVAFTLRREGGVMTDNDGVVSNMGVRQDTYDSYLRSKNVATADVRKMSREEAEKIYREWYWEPTGCDGMPYQLALCVFDFAVNAGGTRAIRFLQKALWIAEDGVIGKETVGAARYADAPQIAYAYLTLRRQYYMKLKDSKYMRGWLARCQALWDHLLATAENQQEENDAVQA